MSLHLMPVYGSPPLQAQLAGAFRAAGKTLNMGKACVRFQSADDLALDAIASVVSKIPMKRWIDIAQAARTPKTPGPGRPGLHGGTRDSSRR